MGGITLVWAIDEQDFMECDTEEQAAQLMAEGKAQDPAIGAALLKHARTAEPKAANGDTLDEQGQGYATRELRAKPPVKQAARGGGKSGP